jgi:hypothetical protein
MSGKSTQKFLFYENATFGTFKISIASCLLKWCTPRPFLANISMAIIQNFKFFGQFLNGTAAVNEGQ